MPAEDTVVSAKTTFDLVKLYYRRILNPDETFEFNNIARLKDDYVMVVEIPYSELVTTDKYLITEWIINMARSSAWFKERQLRAVRFGDIIKIKDIHYIMLPPDKNQKPKVGFNLEETTFI